MADSTLIATPLANPQDERVHAELLAARYRAEFVDLKNFRIQHDLLRTVPVELMFRYNFVPIEQRADSLVIAVSEPPPPRVPDKGVGLNVQRSIGAVATDPKICELR